MEGRFIVCGFRLISLRLCLATCWREKYCAGEGWFILGDGYGGVVGWESRRGSGNNGSACHFEVKEGIAAVVRPHCGASRTLTDGVWWGGGDAVGVSKRAGVLKEGGGKYKKVMVR